MKNNPNAQPHPTKKKASKMLTSINQNPSPLRETRNNQVALHNPPLRIQTFIQYLQHPLRLLSVQYRFFYNPTKHQNFSQETPLTAPTIFSSLNMIFTKDILALLITQNIPLANKPKRSQSRLNIFKMPLILNSQNQHIQFPLQSQSQIDHKSSS